MKARTFVVMALALATASVAFAQQGVPLKFSRVVDLTLPIETNMAGIPGFKIYADNPSQVAIIAAISLTLRKRKDTRHQDPGEQVRARREERVRLVSMPSERDQ